MSEHRGSSVTGSSQLGLPFGLPPGFLPPNGSETVVNPERRGEPTPLPTTLPGIAPANGDVSTNSAIWRVLFPDPSLGLSGTLAEGPEGIELGHFRIESRIRSGGMGAVFRALDTRLKRVVALKILPPAQSRDLASVQRFRNEAQSAAQLDHENIARVFYIGEDRGLHYIAFEYVTGSNLREVIAAQGRLEPGDAVSYALQVAGGLVHMAAHGVVHRDIKPSNIIITPSGRAKLVDLGLARNENRESAELTLAGTTLGTFDYISPEQAKDPRSVDVRSDLYSLGCTLYHMLTGQPPYPEGTVLQKLLDHNAKEVPDPRARNSKVSEDLAAVVRKLMASDPQRRYQTPEHLVRDLLLIAGALGLRSTTSEGLIWMSSRGPRPAAWERHLGWVTTVAVLALVVGVLKYNPSLFLGTPPADALAQSPLPPEARWPTTFGPPPANGESPTVPTPDVAGETADAAEPPAGWPTSPLTPINLADHDSTRVTLGPPDRSPPIASVENRADGGLDISPLVAQTRFGDPLDPDLPRTLGPASGTGPTEPTGVTPPRKPESGSNDATTTRPAAGIVRPPEPPAPAPAAALVILARNDLPDQTFPTLEAACSAAQDGSVIELRFNGVRKEQPIRISKKITIRAAAGYKPLLEFIPAEIPAEGFQTRMITVTGGSLDLIDVNLLLQVREEIGTDQWALFSVQRPDHIRLSDVALTLVNPRGKPAAIAEFRNGATRSMMDMEMEGGKPRTTPEFELVRTLVRGGGDLFYVKHADAVRFIVRDSIVVLDGGMLRTQGVMEGPADNAEVELRIDHVTAVCNDGLLRMEGGDQPRKLVPVQIDATNNIFSTTAVKPLITTTSPLPLEDQYRLLNWTGQKNFYDRFQSFWSLASTDGLGKNSSLDFTGWRRHWGPGTEVDPHADIVLWRRQWSARPFPDLAPADFTLDAAPLNPAISGASQGDAGVNLSALSKLFVLPVPTSSPAP